MLKEFNMEYYVIIPAHNEASFIKYTLDSMVSQTHLPKKLIVVNDNSTDTTQSIIEEYVKKHPWIELINRESTALHLPGKKVIQAFNNGLEHIDKDYDYIVKLDADLILPHNYFEEISKAFQQDPKLGMAGGYAYIERKGEWIIENLTDKDHIRGVFKAYRKECFKQIGGLKPEMGWDTVDELLCHFYGWKIRSIPELKVKHLKPTGSKYDREARFNQGQSFYTLHYGFVITLIAALKLASKKRKPLLFVDYIRGYFKAKKEKRPFLVTEEQGKFIRKFRWERIKSKLI